MLKRLLFLPAICLIAFTGFAQSIVNIQNPSIIPPSPDAAALGKYGQMPVDNSTGIPQISIPLYEIKTPRFSLPISLSYHASGIKVDEVASWVGMGWSLNSGGVITRSVMGLPDEWGTGILVQNLPHAADFQWPRDSLYLKMAAHGNWDTQPDEFYYNFNGLSGGFVFGDGHKPVLTPYKALKINFDSAGGFTIHDEQGNQFYFNNKDSVQGSIAGTLMGVVCSWYITRMVSADLSDTIKFNYTTDALTQNDFSYSFSQNVGPQLSGGEQTTDHLWAIASNLNLRTYHPIRISSIVFRGGKVDFIAKGGRLDNGNYSLDSVILSNFNSSGGYTRMKSFKLLMDYSYSGITNPGPFLGSDQPSQHRLILTGLSENDLNNTPVKTHRFDYNTLLLPPVHNFGQDEWGFYNGQYENPTLLKNKQVMASDEGAVFTIGAPYTVNRDVIPGFAQAGMLQRITYPTGGSTVFNFESNRLDGGVITYYNHAAAVGYHHETDTSRYIFTVLSSTSGGTIFHIQIAHYGDLGYTLPIPPYVELINLTSGFVVDSVAGTASTDVDQTISFPLSFGQQYMLKAVARGGDSSKTTAQLPQATISTSYQIVSGTTTPVGGVRIASIMNYDADSTLLSTETYTYGFGESGGGTLMAGSFQTDQVTHRAYVGPATNSSGNPCASCQGADLSQNITTYYNSSIYPLANLNGSPVGYGTVTIYHGDYTRNTGKTVYTYTNIPDSVLPCNVAYMGGAKPIPVTWKNVGPVREGYYRNIGSNEYALEQEKLTSYNLIQKPAGRGLIVGFVYETIGFDQYNWPYFPVSNIYWFDYPISSGVGVPAQSVVNNYDSTGATLLLTDTTNYFYDDTTLYLPTRTLTADSKKHSILTYTYRPLQKAAINAFATLSSTASAAIDSMVARNMISPVLGQAQYINNSLMQLSITNYQAWDPHVIAPQNIQTQLVANPLETRLQFNKYDASGNPLELQKTSDMKEVYLWGYRGQYPVAKLVNTTYAIASTYITQSVLDNPSSDAALRTQLNNLRSIPNALVTTYTYTPLIGITSQTDPQGKTTFYEYDAFGRLKDVKDKDGNIVKTLDYHYKQP